MKIQLAIIILLLTALALLAATLTIDIPANDVPRVQEAFGSIYGLGHPATQAEVQALTKQWIVDSTKDYERRKAQVQYSPPPLEMQPTPAPTAVTAAVPTAARPTPSPRAATPTATPKQKGQPW